MPSIEQRWTDWVPFCLAAQIAQLQPLGCSASAVCWSPWIWVGATKMSRKQWDSPEVPGETLLQPLPAALPWPEQAAWRT